MEFYEGSLAAWMFALVLGLLTSFALSVVVAILLVVTFFRGTEAKHQRTLLRIAFWVSLLVLGVVVMAFLRLSEGQGWGMEPGPISPFTLFFVFMAETGLLGFLAFRKPWRYLPLFLVAFALYVRLSAPVLFEFF